MCTHCLTFYPFERSGSDRFPNETSALVMVFSILDEERLKWQKVSMKAKDFAWIEGATKEVEQEPIKLEVS